MTRSVPTLDQSDDEAVAESGRWSPARVPAVLWLSAALLATVLSAAVVVWIGSHDVQPFPGDRRPRALVVPVRTVMDDQAIVVHLTVETGAPVELRAPREGLITDVVAPGAVVRTGDVPFRIQDRPVIALSAKAPFWRDLGPGDTGAEVRRLQAGLRDGGFAGVRVSGTFDRATSRALRGLYKRAGLAPRERLRLRDFVWIGPGPIAVAEIKAGIGQDPGRGGVIAEGPARPLRVVLTSPTEGMPGDDQERELVVGDVTLPLRPGQNTVTGAEDVRRISEALQGQEDGSGEVRLRRGVEVFAVPGTAVVTDLSGRTCVFGDAETGPVEVEPIGGSMSEVHLPQSSSLRTVLANPADVLSNPSCG